MESLTSSTNIYCISHTYFHGISCHINTREELLQDTLFIEKGSRYTYRDGINLECNWSSSQLSIVDIIDRLGNNSLWTSWPSFSHYSKSTQLRCWLEWETSTIIHLKSLPFSFNFYSFPYLFSIHIEFDRIDLRFSFLSTILINDLRVIFLYWINLLLVFFPFPFSYQIDLYS